MLNAQQVTIDNQGYALVPSLTPYRYNRVTLDPQNMDGSAELVDSEKRVAPLAGSVSKVVFRTRSGTALLIKARLASGESLPPGSDVWMRAATSSVWRAREDKYTCVAKKARALCRPLGR